MSAMHRLGVILPGRREDGSTSDGRREVYHLGRVLADKGLGGFAVVNALSVSDGTHHMASVWRTGEIEVLAPAARELRDAGCELLVWACTCASFIGGRVWSERQAQALGDSVGLPAISTSLALAAAIADRAPEAVAVVGPYPEELSCRFVAFLREFGIAVRAMVALGCIDADASSGFAIDEVALRLLDCVSRQGLALVLPDTAVDGFALARRLEARTGVTVITANTATLWYALRRLGVGPDYPTFAALGQEADRACAGPSA